MEKELAVITVNYNGSNHTTKYLDSLKKLECKNKIKIFLVDNSSNDNSVDELSGYIENNDELDIEFIVSDQNKGFAAGNNIGLEVALKENYEYIMILNNDVIVDKDIFTPSINFFKTKKDADVVAILTKNPDGNSELYCARSRPSFSNLLFLYHSPLWNKKWSPGYRCHYMKNNDFTKPFPIYTGHGACMVFKKDFFNKTGQFDENTFLFFEEFIIGEKAYKNDMKVYFLPEPYVTHFGGASVNKHPAKSYIEYCKSEKYFIKKYLKYNVFKRMSLYVFRIVNYFYKCLFRKKQKKDYFKNVFKFLKIYLRKQK